MTGVVVEGSVDGGDGVANGRSMLVAFCCSFTSLSSTSLSSSSKSSSSSISLSSSSSAICAVIDLTSSPSVSSLPSPPSLSSSLSITSKKDEGSVSPSCFALPMFALAVSEVLIVPLSPNTNSSKSG